METARLREICSSLPIFVLPRTVLLPGSELPLHVFEERYRALVAHCRASDGVMGIATLRAAGMGAREQADEPAQPDVRPAVWPEVGIGEITHHQLYPDGRCNIRVRYVGRALMRAELPSPHPFRLVRGEVPDDDHRGSATAIASLRMLVLQIGGLSADTAREARQFASLEGMALVDALARRLLEDPDDQRRYLGATRLIERVETVQARLVSFLHPTRTTADA